MKLREFSIRRNIKPSTSNISLKNILFNNEASDNLSPDADPIQTFFSMFKGYMEQNILAKSHSFPQKSH
jgi:hypothetical protein